MFERALPLCMESDALDATRSGYGRPMDIDPRRLSPADLLLAGSAAVLLVLAAAVGWFEINGAVVNPETGTRTQLRETKTAFEAFTGTDVLLVVTCLAAFLIPLVPAPGGQMSRLGDLAMVPLAGALTALIVYRLLEPPEILLATGGHAGEPARLIIAPGASVDLASGIWLGLFAAVGTLVGAILRLRSADA